MNRHCSRLGVLLANLLWFLSCLPGWLAFLLASLNVKRTQTRILQGILRRNAATEWGRARRFASVRSGDDYGSIPLTEYEAYAACLQKVRDGEASVLTRAPVELLQPTSGSTAATKLIPYTRSLRREFRAAIDPWIASLYLAHPAVLLGRHYWSISPATRPLQEPSGSVRVGFADDAEYLGVFQRFLSRALFAVPPEVARVANPDAFEYLALLFLLRERNLRIISVWHPSFLTVLTRGIPGRLSAIAQDIERGEIAASVDLPHDLRRELNAGLSAHPARARELRTIDTARPDFPACLWPRLRVISCWTEGRSEPWLTELASQFPHAAIQGKGLTATEAIVSFPIGAAGRKVCAIRSHYFEFVDAATGQIKRAWEVQPGAEYSVVLTTGGGLYRYRLHDVVRVTGFFNRAPCLEFISRDNLVSDVVGEKLNGKHVEESIRRVEASCRVRFAFAMVAPALGARTAGYVFFVQSADGAVLDSRRAGGLLEEELNRNFHYHHARELSQLQPLRVFRIEGDGGAAYRRHRMEKGVRPGDIKFIALSPESGWGSVFEGGYVA